MELKYKGKTKDVYQLENGNILLKFKDDVTGENGIFNPGANTMDFTIKGIGRAGLRLTKFFYEKLNEMDIPTHYVDSNIENNSMTVLPATMFGKGVELICRYRAVGSFLDRYGLYVTKGQVLDAYVEVTLKDDLRKDPLITDEALAILNIMNKEEYKVLVNLTKEIGAIVRKELRRKNLELYDIKFEFGRVGEDQHIALIDEISGGNMRVYKNGNYIEPLELGEILLK